MPKSTQNVTTRIRTNNLTRGEFPAREIEAALSLVVLLRSAASFCTLQRRVAAFRVHAIFPGDSLELGVRMVHKMCF